MSTSSNHHGPRRPQNQTQSNVMPLGSRDGKVLQSTLPTPLESHDRAGLSYITLRVSRRAGESAQGRSPWTGSAGCSGEAGTGKGLRERKGGIALDGKGTKATNYFPSEANRKDLIRSCATVLLQSRHSTLMLFALDSCHSRSLLVQPALGLLRVPFGRLMHWIYGAGCSQSHTLGLLEVPPPICPQSLTYSRLPRVAPSGHHSQAAFALCPKA